MKILHLLSNWKWTERAEPAADLALAQQRLGHEIIFVCDRSRGSLQDAVEYRAAAKGLATIPVELPKHASFLNMAPGVRALSKLIGEHHFDLIHAHMPNAHLMCAIRACFAPRARRLPIVRSFYEPDLVPFSTREKLLCRYAASGVTVICERAAEQMKSLINLPDSRLEIVEPPVDIERFRPILSREAAKAQFGLASEHFVLGLVTRIRKSRRLDIVIEAVNRLKANWPQLRLLVIGRGSPDGEREELHEPIERLGLQGIVIPAGYCRDEKLVTAYRAMDALAYPQAGTDKSCRTVREAMASGVAVIGARTGFVADSIEDGRTGLLVEQSAAAFACALELFFIRREMALEMGEAARAAAAQRFSPERQGLRMIDFYGRILEEERR